MSDEEDVLSDDRIIPALSAKVEELKEQLARAVRDRQEWLEWADGLTGHQHYLASKMRRDLQARVEQYQGERDATETQIVERRKDDVDDEMRILLRSWIACMQKPRREDWERIADNLCKDTVLLLGEMTRNGDEIEKNQPD